MKSPIAPGRMISLRTGISIAKTLPYTRVLCTNHPRRFTRNLIETRRINVAEKLRAKEQFR
jgi:hypothetical protein